LAVPCGGNFIFRVNRDTIRSIKIIGAETVHHFSCGIKRGIQTAQIRFDLRNAESNRAAVFAAMQVK
jgi:hypothetical protein